MKKRRLIVVLLAILSVVASSKWMMRAQDTPQRIEITAKRFEYTPAEITVKKGQPVDLLIKSLDVTHGFSLPELNLTAEIAKGKTAELQFTPDKTGDFVAHCSFFCGPGHGGMMLTIHVVD